MGPKHDAFRGVPLPNLGVPHDAFRGSTETCPHLGVPLNMMHSLKRTEGLHCRWELNI